MRVVLVALLLSCVTAPEPELTPARAPHASAAPPWAPKPVRQLTRHYTVWLGGARVGTASEYESWTNRRVHLRRAERMRFLRADTEVEVVTTIDIDANAALTPTHLVWRQQQGGDDRFAEAVRSADGWQITMAHGGAVLDGDAVPAELVPLIVRRDGHFEGSVFLPGRGFLFGDARIEPVAAGRLVAQVALHGGPLLEATIDLDRDGAPARIVDGEGVIAMRASEPEIAAPFRAVDLIAATSLAIRGTKRAMPSRIVLAGELAVPPLPGQLVRSTKTGLDLELDARLPGELPDGPRGADRRGDIDALVAAVRARITPDLAAARGDPVAATAGDCTTFALAYAALASARGIPTRVVTGLRVDRDRLVRHRWAVSWTGRAWIAVDAAFGAVPAGGDLIGLAVHDADDAGLVAGEAALTRVHAAAWE